MTSEEERTYKSAMAMDSEYFDICLSSIFLSAMAMDSECFDIYL